jgi:hypothetical protein
MHFVLPVFVLACMNPAQAQQGTSLADAARQARSQKQANPQSPASSAQALVDEMQQDQDDQTAPAGFKTYNAGDYKLSVPAPFKMEGPDDGGTVLAGPQNGSTRPLVLAGNSLVFPWGNSDAAFLGSAEQFAHMYADSSNCTKTTVGSHAAYQCSLSGAKLLGHSVSGNVTLVRGSKGIFPVLCAAYTDSRARDLYNDPHSNYATKRWALEVMQHEDQDVRAVWHTCEAVLESIRLTEDGKPASAQAASAQNGSTAQSNGRATPKLRPAQSAQSAVPAGGPEPSAPASLAEIASGLHQAPVRAAKAEPAPTPTPANEARIAPAGFKVHSFTYCTNDTQPCRSASVFVPADATLLCSDCKQYVFEAKVNGEPFLLLAGVGGPTSCARTTANGPDMVRWNQLAEPESARAPGTASTVSSLQTKLDGKPATLTQLKFRKGMDEWLGKRADVESNGIPLVVGCMAPKDRFPSGDAICSTLIDSLRLP